VAIEINLNSTLNNNINAAEITMMNNNPQNGATVPQAFKDANLNTTPDDDAVSGYVSGESEVPLRTTADPPFSSLQTGLAVDERTGAVLETLTSHVATACQRLTTMTSRHVL
jgi:hypothetical protein